MESLKVLLVLLAVIAAASLTIRFRRAPDYRIYFWAPGLAIGLVLIVASLLAGSAVGQVNAGERGVVLRFGAITHRTLGEGLYFVTPFVNTVEVMDVQTHAYEAQAGAASSDLQDVQTTVTLNYRLDPTRVNSVYQNLRRDYEERIVAPAIQEAVKSATAGFRAEELITRRGDVKFAVENQMRERLATHGIMLETVSITNFAFSPVFTQAIEAKVAAQQRALEAENRLLQIQVEAKQAEAAAKGQADAAIAKARGDAEAITTVAEAQARANERVNATLTDAIIRYALAQKLGDDIRVLILPSGQNFILGPEVLGTAAQEGERP
jgi:regulator of protease activity HflC (stomatin/prohibitin superfamily)